ncbi:hypothetical protein E5K00_14225 [Hymenobacter aquaticus]|uniref:DUF4251 domain-containing protein n=1 Tax=Hymenobacter aquaticus TaxID=1867101 RepID=A0A4Z0PVU4_9BACT|nr:hypothetical protein [Hymenobacter aquaticus]TGE21439.1 hypothetical protein E5K00_14225 [Hymenobacter aquaticus]
MPRISPSPFKWMLTLIPVLFSACLPYTNRTSYSAHTIMPTTATVADSTQPIVAFDLRRELTSKVYPLVGYLGEKGDFSLSVQLFGAGAKRYNAFVLKSMEIASGGKVHFATADSSFIHFQLFREEDNMRYHKSGYVIALADTVKKPSLRVTYELVSNNGRKLYEFNGRLSIDRKRGLDGY